MLPYASIFPLDAKSNGDGTGFVPLYYLFPFGTGDSITESSALVKPFKRLFELGKWIGKIAFVFYREDDSYFTLGSFAFTDKIIFFPGTTISRVIHTLDGKQMTNGVTHNIEHLTLQENFTNWHFKLQQKKTKYSNQKTRKLDNDVILWFVMGIQRPSMLEPMPMTQEYVLKGPEKHLQKRLDYMSEAIEGQNFPIIEIIGKPASPSFLNFEFFLSTKKLKELNVPDMPILLPSDCAKIENVQIMPSKIIDDFSPNESFSISIRASRVKGSLLYDAVYYPGGKLPL
jgi:hypothetical protein